MDDRVVITGANSAVGQAILRLGSQYLPSAVLVAAVRSESALQELPSAPRQERLRISYDDAASLRGAFAGASAVVHLAGTLIERPNASYDRVNLRTTQAVVSAAADCGVAKVVFVSAVGANAASSNGYWRSKGQAEDAVRAGRCAHTILRVPLLLGPGTEATAALHRHLSHASVTLPGGGRNWQQPLHVDDLARAALAAAAPATARNCTLDFVGPEAVHDREILERGARILGRDVRIRSMPILPLKVALAVRRRFSGSGFSPTVLEVITADTKLDPRPAAAELRVPLTGLDEMIRQSLTEPARPRA